MDTAVMFSSASDMWATPQDFYDGLNGEFHFTLDPCATPENAKCQKYYTEKENGLNQDWAGETVFCNPPYGRAIKDWVKKCYEESRNPDTTVVMLIPAPSFVSRWRYSLTLALRYAMSIILPTCSSNTLENRL